MGSTQDIVIILVQARGALRLIFEVALSIFVSSVTGVVDCSYPLECKGFDLDWGAPMSPYIVWEIGLQQIRSANRCVS